MPVPRFARPILAIAAAALLSSCGLFGDSGPVQIAAIGPLNPKANPIRGELSAPNAAMLGMMAQGLVSFDSAGEIDVGLADRWTVTGDGRSYIFRIRAAKWSGGGTVRAGQVALLLSNYLAPGSNHVLRADFPEVETIKAMTDEVIEIRLKVPQSDLLELLAQPSMAILRNGQGWGPMRPRRNGRTILLSPVPDPLAEYPDEAEAAARDPAASVELVGTSGAGAIARFQNGYADGIIGGRFSTLPYFVASKIGRSRLVVDPAPGLFGLAFVNAEGFLAIDSNRDALARSIRRQRLVAAFGLSEWMPQSVLRPTLYLRKAGPSPVPPPWQSFDAASRAIQASRVVASYKAGGRTIAPLRIAVPNSPGGRILFAYIAADFKRIGVPSRRVGMDSDADLRLIDEVAPYDDPIWFLRRLTCHAGVICNRDAEKLIEAAELTADATERTRLLSEAETVLVRYTPFIPLATPLRWSVTSARLTGFRANDRSQHPLNQLIASPN